MSEDTILEGVRDVLQQHVQVTRPVGLQTDLIRDLELDSLKRLTLVVELENRFRIRFDSGDEEGLQTVGDLVRLVARRLAQGQGETAGPGS